MNRVWLFMGPPGCGKGTQAAKLKAEGLAKHLSTGDLLRAAMRSESSLGRSVREFVDNGRLVPDEVMLEVISEELVRATQDGQVILDGYPRTLNQAESLVEMVSKNAAKMELGGAIWFNIPADILVKRAVSRRICGGCGAIFNLEFKPPKVEGKCDACGSDLQHRKDDTAETIAHRIGVYTQDTEPLLAFFKHKGLVTEIDANQDENLIYKEIVNYIKK